MSVPSSSLGGACPVRQQLANASLQAEAAYVAAVAETQHLRGTPRFSQSFERAAELREAYERCQAALAGHEREHGCAVALADHKH